MKEVTVGIHSYRIGELDAFDQFHVQRRLTPVMLAIGGSFIDLARKDEPAPAEDQAPAPQPAAEPKFDPEDARGMLDFMAPAMEVVARMSDEDTNYILMKCLKVVHRREGDRWASLLNANGKLQYQDLKMHDMVRLTVEVVKENLGDFFSLLPGGKL